jgi:multiple sugar transport system permease protein
MEKAAYALPDARARRRLQLGMKASRRLGHGIAYVLVLGYVAIALLPVVWMVSTSLQTEEQLRIQSPIQWVPHPLRWANYAEGWRAADWLLCLRNTLYYACGHTLGAALSVTIVAYGFARIRFPGRDLLMFINICLMLLPGQVTMVPRFILFAKLGWVGGFKPVVVPPFFAMAPYFVFMLRQFFRAIPEDLSDAARIDGCNELGIFLSVILPLSKPVLAIMIAGRFSQAWNNLLMPMIYLQKPHQRTLVLAMKAFIIGDRGEVSWGQLMAMSTLMALPMVLVYFILQRYFTQAFIISGLKG